MNFADEKHTKAIRGMAELDVSIEVGGVEPEPEPEPAAFVPLRPDQRTALLRAQQNLAVMKMTNPALLADDSVAHELDFDLVIAAAAAIPAAHWWAFGTYRLEIKWNGSKLLRLDDNGAHWIGEEGEVAATGPFTINEERQLTTTIYNPSATSAWSARNGGEANQRGLTESLDVLLAETSADANDAKQGGGGKPEPREFQGSFQRQHEGPLPVTGVEVAE